MKQKNPFELSFFEEILFLPVTIKYWFKMKYMHMKYPENIWYGGGLKRETALLCVGKGWQGLINNLYDAKPKSVNVLQVKEKYAQLRFYISPAPEWYHDLIDYYEHKSGTICEWCGEPGKIRNDLSWILTLCDDCYNNHNL